MENRKEFKIYNTTTHRFGIKSRLLILFGKPLKQSLTITVNNEVEVLKTESIGYIEDLFPKKSIGMTEIPQYNNSEFNQWAASQGWRKLEQSEDWSNGEVHRTERELYELFENYIIKCNEKRN